MLTNKTCVKFRQIKALPPTASFDAKPPSSALGLALQQAYLGPGSWPPGARAHFPAETVRKGAGQAPCTEPQGQTQRALESQRQPPGVHSRAPAQGGPWLGGPGTMAPWRGGPAGCRGASAELHQESREQKPELLVWTLGTRGSKQAAVQPLSHVLSQGHVLSLRGKRTSCHGKSADDARPVSHWGEKQNIRFLGTRGGHHQMLRGAWALTPGKAPAQPGSRGLKESLEFTEPSPTPSSPTRAPQPPPPPARSDGCLRLGDATDPPREQAWGGGREDSSPPLSSGRRAVFHVQKQRRRGEGGEARGFSSSAGLT